MKKLFMVVAALFVFSALSAEARWYTKAVVDEMEFQLGLPISAIAEVDSLAEASKICRVLNIESYFEGVYTIDGMPEKDTYIVVFIQEGNPGLPKVYTLVYRKSGICEVYAVWW